LSIACRSRADAVAVLVVLWLVVLPGTAAAQRDRFFDTLPRLYRALAGAYGDEGPQIIAHIETLSAASAQWERETGLAELDLRPRLARADRAAALDVRTTLATLYAERSRFVEAVREVDEAIRIDPSDASLYGFKASLLQAANKPSEAAEAFRAAWLRDADDPQNAYRLVVHRSAATTAAEIERARAALEGLERQLVHGQLARVESPFLALTAINDDVGSAMPFAPAAYAVAFSRLLNGEFDAGIAALRAAAAGDPVVADPAARSEAMTEGIVALRQGRVEQAVALLNTAASREASSSEAHRILGTAHGINGDVANSLKHLREAVRLNPRDERSWLALARSLAATDVDDAVGVLRTALTNLTEAGAVRWLRSELSARRQRTDDGDLDLIRMADTVVLIAGRGEFYGRVAVLAQRHLEYDRAIDLLEQRVAQTPNNAAAHRALGQAYTEQGRDDTGYAHLIASLLLDPSNADTLTAIGRLHLAAGRPTSATEALERAVALEPTDGQALQALGEALARAGRTAEGQQRVEAASRLLALRVEEQRRRRTAGTLAAEAELNMRAQQYDRAVALWQQVVDLDSQNAGSYLRLADALAQAKRLAPAANQLEKAISLNAGPEAHRRLAEVYAALGRRDESARERQRYTEYRVQELRRGAGGQ
jgi:tetratricopeptide (TPR) repeat protein